ncbi:MAG: response regulator [Bacteroidales bacterium]|jgi:CheY-like chemotaxis protein|nr:response regulator [Bacteroidales bacterium]
MKNTVLIVDDSNTNNLLLQNILENVGINSSIAFSGEEAFEYLKIEKPSLILLDIMMPNIDGFTVLKKIKNNLDTKEIPVIFITAKNDDNLKQKALDQGAVALIQKPIDVNRVVELVKQHVLN